MYVCIIDHYSKFTFSSAKDFPVKKKKIFEMMLAFSAIRTLKILLPPMMHAWKLRGQQSIVTAQLI